MKVFGMLEKAMMELLASTSPTPTPTGRFYADVTTPTAAIPRFYNGSSWLPFLLGQSTALITTNSGISVTVDWSKGLFQQIVLTGHCVISFSNPVPGSVHTLLVTQRATEVASITPYQYKLNLVDQDSRRLPYQPVSAAQSSENAVYSWFYSIAVRAAYATVPVTFSSPFTVATAATGIDCYPSAIQPGALSISIGVAGSPFVGNWQCYDAGQKYMWGAKNASTPATAAAAVVAVDYSPDGNCLATANGTTPFIQTWMTDVNKVSALTVFTNPVTIPAGAATSIAFHPSGMAVGVGHATTPFMSFYPFSSTVGYGTKYTNPVALPAAQVNSVAFSPCGEFLAAVGQTTPFLQVWSFDPFTGFGSILANPGTLPAGGPAGSLGKGVAWRPQGDFIAVAMTTSPWLYIVSFNRTGPSYGGSISTASSGLTAACTSVQWTPDGQYLLVGSTASPFLAIFDFSASIIGASVSYDASNPGATVNDIVVAPNGEVAFLAMASSPFLMATPLPRKVRNYLRFVD